MAAIGVGSQFDAGAIRIANPSNGDVEVDRVTVDIGSHHWDIWPASLSVPAHGSLILTQTRVISAQPLQPDFDTSEVSCDANSSSLQPHIHIRVGGQTMDFTDEKRVLNAGGSDRGCPGSPPVGAGFNESHPWEPIGVVPSTNTIVSALVVGFVGFLPKLLAAGVVLAAGSAAASGLGHLTAKVADTLGFGAAADKGALVGVLAVLPVRDRDANSLLGTAVKWFVVILTLELVASALGISVLSSLLTSVLLYLPKLVIAVIVLVVGSLLARTTAGAVREASVQSGVGTPALAGRVTEYSVIAFSAIVALSQAGIGTTILDALVAIVSLAVALAIGLAFGLGAQDAARTMIEGLYSRLRSPV